MAQGRMLWCTKDEDRLIRRGANPRTGLISPFISDEIGDDSAGNDYVKARDVRQDCGPISNAQVRVSVIPCPSRPSDTRASRGLGSPIRRRKLPLTDTLTHQSPPTPPNSLFEIPRKPVGGQRASLTPTSVPHSGTEQMFRHLKHLSGSRKYTNGAPSPARLDAENVALGLHAYPFTASECRSTKYDQTRSETILQPFSKHNAHKPDSTRIKSCTINDYVASIDPIVPHQRPRTPDLGKAYRRPKMLSPMPMPHENARISTSHAKYQTSADAISVQRPQVRRLSASTVIHQFDIARGKATSISINQLGLSHMSQEGDVCGHRGSSFESTSRPIQLGGSTFVSRQTFHSSMGHDSHSDVDKKPPFQQAVKQPPPLWSLNEDVKTYLSAAWCIMVTTSYLVIFLCVFAAGFRTLELLVEFVHCIWFTFGVLLNVVRWVLTT
ncbi:MAG: hypothetical protein Q9180_000959 [Flavoplaca navasiana]